jgi:hypothetical protein
MYSRFLSDWKAGIEAARKRERPKLLAGLRKNAHLQLNSEIDSESTLWSNLLQVDACRTYDEAAAHMRELAIVLSTRRPGPGACGRAQLNIARILGLSNPLSLAGPGSKEEVYSKALECYALLARYVRDAGYEENLSVAIADAAGSSLDRSCGARPSAVCWSSS